MFGKVSNCEVIKRDYECLRDEISRRDQEESDRREREYNDQERRRRERQAEREAGLHEANDWSEAFENGIALFAREARGEERDEAADPQSPYNSNFFRNALIEAQFAQSLYEKNMSEIRQQISELENIAREKTAAEVEAKYPKSSLPESLRENDYESLVCW